MERQKANERKKRAQERNQRSKRQHENSSEDVAAKLPARKKCKTAAQIDYIDPNECCICFRTFQEDEIEKSGLEWVKCACTRWLHEECIDYKINVDLNGKELLCPFCCI